MKLSVSFKKNSLPLLLSVLLAGCISFYLLLGIYFFVRSFTPVTPLRSDNLQQGIADEVLRLHVIADSNSDADQQVKLQIKEAVITYLEPVLATASTKEEATASIRAQLPELEAIADSILQKNGFSYRSGAAITRSYFPIKTYGDLTLPAGEYDALKISLGTASGKNWWCLVFPKLCFVDVTYGTLPEASKDELKELLTEEEYSAVLNDSAALEDILTQSKSKKPKVRFRLWEWLKDWF
ncbi:MAG: stage II sporulation protein R [Lachnospiraceae bacterium]|nr:stage II sporulation protein R [Lachnospiraceae bacterium]